MIKTLNLLLDEFDYVVEIRNFNLNRISWKSEFIKNMEGWGFLVEGDLLYRQSYIYENNNRTDNFTREEIGKVDFMYPHEIDVLFQAHPECPFLSETESFFCVKLESYCEFNDLEQLLYALTKEAMGKLYYKLSGEVKEHHCVENSEIDGLTLHKYSFRDGGALLTYDRIYLNYIINAYRSELKRNHYDAYMYLILTGHNPIRYHYLYELSPKGERIRTIDMVNRGREYDEFDFSIISGLKTKI